MSYPLQKARTLFEIAKDVPDNRLEKAFFEADSLDLSPKLGMLYAAIPKTYLENTDTYIGADYVICYYMFARYLQTADQASTATGLKLQTYNGSIVLPDNSRIKRFEAERGKADLFVEGLMAAMKKDGVIKEKCTRAKSYRIGLIK